jgi:hypothetical protein
MDSGLALRAPRNDDRESIVAVIASEATQSRTISIALDCFGANAPRNDGGESEIQPGKQVAPGPHRDHRCKLGRWLMDRHRWRGWRDGTEIAQTWTSIADLLETLECLERPRYGLPSISEVHSPISCWTWANSAGRASC